MTPEDDPLDGSAPRPGEFVFPGATVRSEDAASDEEESDYVVFQTVAATDARELCSRLESHGIPCEICASEDAAGASPKEHRVDIRIREIDRAPAEEAIARHAMEDDGSAEEDRERLIASWICPECRKQTLVLLPLTGGARYLRFAWVAVLLIPLVVILFLLVSPAPEIEQTIQELPDWWPAAWLGIVAALAAAAILPTRARRCAECDWRSDNNSQKPDRAG